MILYYLKFLFSFFVICFFVESGERNLKRKQNPSSPSVEILGSQDPAGQRTWSSFFYLLLHWIKFCISFVWAWIERLVYPWFVDLLICRVSCKEREEEKRHFIAISWNCLFTRLSISWYCLDLSNLCTCLYCYAHFFCGIRCKESEEDSECIFPFNWSSQFECAIISRYVNFL